MSDLQNLTPANSYKGLLQVGDYTNGVDSTVKAVLDGEGTASALAIGTTKVGIGTTSPTQELDVNGDIVSTTLTTSGAVTAGSVSTSGAVTGGSLDVSGNVVADEYALDQTGTSSSAVAIHAPATNELAIRTNSTEAIRIDSDGNCGIGTASPSAKLEVNSGLNDSCLHLKSTDPFVDFKMSDDTTTDGGIRVSNKGDNLLLQRIGGNVGIGTESPSAKLHLSTAGTDGLRLGVDSETYYHMIRPNGDSLYLGADDGDTGGVGADIRFSVKGDEKMRITKEGHVGIGTQSASTSLDINKGLTESEPIITLSRGETPKGRVAIANATSSILYGSVTNDLCIRSEGHNIKFGTAEATRTDMTIDSNGNVGIGTVSPSAPLEVASTTGGVIMPRMNTSQRTAISASNGEMVYDTDLHKFYGYANGAWTALH